MATVPKCVDLKCRGVKLGLGQCDACYSFRQNPPVVEGKRHSTLKLPGAFLGITKAAQDVFDRAQSALAQKSKLHGDIVGKKRALEVSMPPMTSVFPPPKPHASKITQPKKQAVAPHIPHQVAKAITPLPQVAQAITPIPQDSIRIAVAKAPSPAPFVPQEFRASPSMALGVGGFGSLFPMHDNQDVAYFEQHDENAEAVSAVPPDGVAGLSGSAGLVPLARKASAAANQREKSKRLDSSGVPFTHTELCNQAKNINKGLPKNLQLKNTQQKKIHELDAWLQLQQDTVAQATIMAVNGAARSKLTPEVNVRVCMRILMLIANYPQLLELYLDSCGGSTQKQCDGHKIPGQGSGVMHQFWFQLEVLFNDTSIVSDFPFEYTVDSERKVFSSVDPLSEVLTPAKFRSGFFVALGIKQPNCPENFPDGFFDTPLLMKLFTAGMCIHFLAVLFCCFNCAIRNQRIPEQQLQFPHQWPKRVSILVFRCSCQNHFA